MLATSRLRPCRRTRSVSIGVCPSVSSMDRLDIARPPVNMILNIEMKQSRNVSAKREALAVSPVTRHVAITKAQAKTYDVSGQPSDKSPLVFASARDLWIEEPMPDYPEWVMASRVIG